MNTTKASSFADYDDLIGFYRAISEGKTVEEAFAFGDNGIGKWGEQTAQLRKPMVALPPEDWLPFNKTQMTAEMVEATHSYKGSLLKTSVLSSAKGKKVRVFIPATGKSVIAELQDTMPHKADIKNGAGIDLNPAACQVLNLVQPVLIDAQWEWV